MLDRITEHSARHSGGMIIKEINKFLTRDAFPDLSKHPSTRFLYEIVIEERLWIYVYFPKDSCEYTECHRFTSCFNLRETREYDDPNRPEMITLEAGGDEFLATLLIQYQEIGTDDILCGRIDEIPVIDTVDMIDVKLCYVLKRILFLFHEMREQNDSGKSIFMVWAREKYIDIFERSLVLIELCCLTYLWHGES